MSYAISLVHNFRAVAPVTLAETCAVLTVPSNEACFDCCGHSLQFATAVGVALCWNPGQP